MKQEHIVRFERGHDCVRFKCVCGKDNCFPGSGGSHGVHGLTIRFVSKGEAGAVQFVLYTGWLPQYVKADNIGYRNVREKAHEPMPSDLGYHSKTPRYDGQTAIEYACEFCDGKLCYYDGSGLNANDAFYALVNGGDDALWTFLDAYYASVFDGEPYPSPAEYPFARRAA